MAIVVSNYKNASNVHTLFRVFRPVAVTQKKDSVEVKFETPDAALEALNTISLNSELVSKTLQKKIDMSSIKIAPRNNLCHRCRNVQKTCNGNKDDCGLEFTTCMEKCSNL